MNRCQALASSGRQCRTTECLELRHYHGDGEIYDWHGPEPAWVKVWLCMKHRKAKAKRAAQPEEEKPAKLLALQGLTSAMIRGA